MQNFKALKTRTWFAISLILSFAMVTFGCDASKLVLSKNDVSVVMTAENVPEGIRLSFNNIPPNTARMFINVQNNKDDYAGDHDTLISFCDLRDSSLEKVKQSKTVIVPIINAGKDNWIFISFADDQNYSITEPIDIIHAAGNDGIILSFGELTLNDDKSAVSLSKEPVFSSEVIFDPQKKYSFNAIVMRDNRKASFSIGEHHYPAGLSSDGLSWTFEPYWVNELIKLKEDGDCGLETGTYPAFCRAYCNIFYNNIRWSVQIAKSPEYKYSL